MNIRYKVGDRVQYIGNLTPQLYMMSGTVIDADSMHRVRIEWDQSFIDNAGLIRYVYVAMNENVRLHQDEPPLPVPSFEEIIKS